jgi:NADPH2:quinone reductase
VTEAYNVKASDTVPLYTIAGGLGLLFAQIAKACGATVIRTTSSEAKANIAKEAGTGHVVLYRNKDTVKRVMEITDGRGVEAAVDGVGKDT